MSSALPGFFKLTTEDRLNKITDGFGLSPNDVLSLSNPDFSLNLATADTMVENMIGRHVLPVGVATNFIIDGKEVLIPMAIEEPSVIAGASLSAKLARPCGGFTTASGQNMCTGQIVLIPPIGEENPITQIDHRKLVEIANTTMPTMVERTGGTQRATSRLVETESGPMVIVELFINVGDSMGANCVTKACEACKDYLATTLRFEPLMGILTNLSKNRLVHATAKWRTSDLAAGGFDGLDVAKRVVMACNLAKVDPIRAATHRKGIMNGVTAVCIATGNDSRAVEADVHSYANLPQSNPALTTFRIDDDMNLVGEIWIPLTVGTIGGSANRNGTVIACRKMMKVETANDLAKAMAAVGLAQNFAALRALVTNGISEGHMKLHSRNIACEAGAKDVEIEQVAQKLIQNKSISVAAAKAVLRQLRCSLT